MIKGTGICKNYMENSVLRELDVNINRGSIYGLVGENGCGKTTLLKTLTGIFKAEQGRVLIENEEVYANPWIKEKVFFMSEESYCFKGYSIKNLAEYFSGFYSSFSWEKFSDLEKKMKFNINAKFSSLSKGQKKQAMLIIGLAITPEIMILDEPLDGLDPLIRNKMKKLLVREVAEREMTMIISSHNMLELEDLCDHIGIMDDGKLMIESSIEDVKKELNKVQYVISKDGSEVMEYNDATVVKREKRGKVTVDILKGDIYKIREQFDKKKLIFFEIIPMTLEEIFIAEMEGKDYEIQKIMLK